MNSEPEENSEKIWQTKARLSLKGGGFCLEKQVEVGRHRIS